MKLNRKIIVSVLLALTIFLMFLPVATFNDNSALEYNVEIENVEKKITRADDKIARYQEHILELANYHE